MAKNKPIIVSIPTNPSKIVVTDGFHITKPLEVTYLYRNTYHFQIVCGIQNDQLIIGAIIGALVYMMGVTSGMIFLQVLSTAPILYFLFLYYVKRKEFIQIRAM